MKLRILFNSEAVRKSLSVGWGFSCLVNQRVLFDTGEDADSLANNMDAMGVDMNSLDAVVISHDHFDHTGGLPHLVRQKEGLKIFICPGFGKDFKETMRGYHGEIHEVSHFSRITSHIYSTGEMVGNYKRNSISEQALIVKTQNGFSVITGCAHPGIVTILQRVKEQLDVKEFYAVVGGFHLRKHSSRDIEKVVAQCEAFHVRNVGPTHCSGEGAEKIFRKHYGNRLLSLKVGEEIEI